MGVVRIIGGAFAAGILALSACSSSSSGLSFPDVSAIISAAAPSSFAAGARTACGSGYGSVTNIYSCISAYVLSDTEPSGAVGQWFLYWINTLDGRLAELVTRFSENPPACQSAAPVDISFTIDSTTSDTVNGTSSLVIPASFSCYDSYTGPDGVTEAGGIAWGTKDGETYLMDRSSGNSGLSGVERIISVAKVNAAGDEAEIWVMQNGTSSNTPNIMRLKGNKTTKVFSYENRAGHNNNYFQYLYIRSDGANNMYVTASDDDGTDLASTLGSSKCVKPDNYATTASDCTSLNLDKFPTSTFMGTDTSIGTVASAAGLYTAINAIMTYDLTGAGVGTVD